MKRNMMMIRVSAVLLLAVGQSAFASGGAFGMAGGETDAFPPIEGVSARDARVTRDGSKVAVDMKLDVSGLKVNSVKAVLLTPCLVSGTDTLDLPSVGLYGRQRYYYYLRNDHRMSGEDETSFRTGENPDVIPYHADIAYKEWMNGCRLVLRRSDYSCCEEKTGGQVSELVANALWTPATPGLVYVSPQGEKVKTRSLSGTAYIDFPVDRTEIYPDYHNNVLELGRIRATIDSVRNDSDITVSSIWLKGFASPEATYAHNTDLARERTNTIREYVLKLYHFDPSIVKTDYEPENWEGLIAWLRASSLPESSGILKIAQDGSVDPDVREFRIRRNYPAAYKVMKSEIYPRLRCTKYRIEYSIRGFSDPEEILRVMKANPRKLSLNEFFVAGESLAAGSPEFNEVFETAAVMYPEDKVANLNAANAAMERGDLVTAEGRLKKAGESGEAEYARGVLAVMMKEYAAAAVHFRNAEAKGVVEAAGQAKIFEEYARYAKGGETGGLKEKEQE